MKHSKKKSCSKKQDRLEPASLNVTQAAVHKERWREEITHKKIKINTTGSVRDSDKDNYVLFTSGQSQQCGGSI